MARRVSWTNNSSGHAGTYVYRAETLDPQNLPAPVATVDPVAQGATAEWIDNAELEPGDYDYAVQDFDGEGVGALSAVEVYNKPDPYASAAIGDEVGGGIYAGIDTIVVDGTTSIDYHIIAGKAESEARGPQWKTSDNSTEGTYESSDGLASTLAMEAAGLSDHPAAAHCLAYEGGGFTDWHMPARTQVTLIYNNLAGHAEFATNSGSGDFTWTSTHGGSDTAWARRFSDGTQLNQIKTPTTRRTRPIRRVPV